MNRRGFTLVELLIVTVLFSFLGLVLYTSFYQGTALWKRAQADRGELRDIFFAEKMASDLRGMIPLAGRAIAGREKTFEFYALILGRELGQQGEAAGTFLPCRLRYRWDAARGQVWREIQSYSQVLTDSRELRRQESVLEHVRSFRLEYYGRAGTFQANWRRQWEKECLPNAVKISVEYDDQKQNFVRILNVPGGGCRLLNPKAA